MGSTGSAIGMMAFGLVVMGVMVLLVVQLVWTLVVSLTRPRRFRAHPACEGCGYSVAGLTGLSCPECGSDLRTVGIITPRMEGKRRGSTLGAIMAWTVLIGGVMFVMGQTVFMTVGLRAARASATVAAANAQAGGSGAITPGAGVMTQMNQVLTPSSGAYSPIDVAFTQSPGFGSGAATTSVSMSLPGPGQGTAMFTTTTGARDSFMATDRLGKVTASGTTPAKADLVAWLAGAGMDTSAAGVSEEADELLQVIGTAAALNAPPTGSLYSGSAFTPGVVNRTSTPVPQFLSGLDTALMVMLVMFGVAVLVWGGGVWFIVARRRKMFREVAVS